MDQASNDNPSGPWGAPPSRRDATSAKDPALGGRLRAYALAAWIALWALVFGPFVIAFLWQFEWNWPAAAAAFAALTGDGLAFFRATTPWYPLLIVGLAAFFLLCRRLAEAQLPAAARPKSKRSVLAVRLALFAVSVIGLSVSVEKLAFLTDAVVESPFFEPPEDEKAFRDTLLAELGRAALMMDFDAVITEALARGDIDHARVHVQAAELLGRPLKPATRAAYGEATNWSNTALREGWDAFRGLVTGESDSLASFAGALAGDLTPYGDVRDITVQLGVKDQPDDLILGLSVFGLSLTALSFIAPQQATPIRTGKAALKTASRFAKASAGVSADIRRITNSTVDLPAFKQAARNLDITPDFAVRFVRRQGIDELGRVSTDLYDIGQAASTGTAIAVLKHADTLADLPFYKRIAKGFGESAEAVIGVLGKNTKRAFRVFKAGTHLKAEIDRSVATLVASIAGLLLSLSGSVTSFLLKKLTLGFTRA